MGIRGLGAQGGAAGARADGAGGGPRARACSATGTQSHVFRHRAAGRPPGRPAGATLPSSPSPKPPFARARGAHRERRVPPRPYRAPRRERRVPPTTSSNERVTHLRHSLHLHFCNSREQTPLQGEQALCIPAVERRDEAGPVSGAGFVICWRLIGGHAGPREASRVAQKETGPLGTDRFRASGGGGAAMRYVATRSLRLGHERVLKNSS
jgi:hypothetical protein